MSRLGLSLFEIIVRPVDKDIAVQTQALEFKAVENFIASIHFVSYYIRGLPGVPLNSASPL
jgi:hypothetical protein